MRRLPASPRLLWISCAVLLLGPSLWALSAGRASRVPLTGAGDPAGRAAEPPRLELEAHEIALGRLRPGEERRAQVGWRRRGAGVLRVLGVRSACGCALVDPLPRELPAGASGSLGLRLTARRAPGPQRHRIRIVTDAAPGLDVLDIWIGGHVESDVAITPTRVVLPPGQGGVEITSAVEVRWDRSSAGALVPLARLVGVAGRVDVLPPAAPGADACQIVFSVRRPEAPGRLRGWLELDLGARGPIAVPIEGVVHPRRPEAGDAPPR